MKYDIVRRWIKIGGKNYVSKARSNNGASCRCPTHINFTICCWKRCKSLRCPASRRLSYTPDDLKGLVFIVLFACSLEWQGVIQARVVQFRGYDAPTKSWRERRSKEIVDKLGCSQADSKYDLEVGEPPRARAFFFGDTERKKKKTSHKIKRGF